MRLPSRARSLNMCGEHKQSYCDAMSVASIYQADIYYAAVIGFIFTVLPWQPLCVIVCDSCFRLCLSERSCYDHISVHFQEGPVFRGQSPSTD